MTWSYKPIASPLPDEAQAIADDLSAVITSIQPIIDAAVALLDAAKIFFQAGVDPYAALMSAIITETENLINDLFGTGAYELIIDPFKVLPGTRDVDKYGIFNLTPGQAINAAIQSFEDDGDPNRPQFSDSAEVAAFGFMIIAPDINLFLNALNTLTSVWSVADIQLSIRRLTEAREGAPLYSKKPDWGSLRFNQVAALGNLQKQLLKILALAKGYAVVADDALTDLIDALARKIQIIQDAIDDLQAVIDALTASVNVYYLDLPKGTGGNSRVKEALLDDTLSSLRANKYSLMLLYLGGGPSAEGVDNIRKLFE